jgi:hypothetical protein
MNEFFRSIKNKVCDLFTPLSSIVHFWRRIVFLNPGVFCLRQVSLVFRTEFSMQTPFDLLRKDLDGFIWLEAATDLEVARKRLRELASYSPGEYVLFDHTSQETIEKISSTTLSSWASKGASNPRFAKPQ